MFHCPFGPSRRGLETFSSLFVQGSSKGWRWQLSSNAVYLLYSSSFFALLRHACLRGLVSSYYYAPGGSTHGNDPFALFVDCAISRQFWYGMYVGDGQLLSCGCSNDQVLFFPLLSTYRYPLLVGTSQEQLDKKLLERQALETGICPVREDLYTQGFGKSSCFYHKILWYIYSSMLGCS